MRHHRVLILLAVTLFANIALAAGPLPDVLSGDGLTVRFADKSATPRGTIELGGQSYPFTAAFRDNRLAGSFQADGKAFPFTMAQNGNGFILESEGTRYALSIPGAGPPIKGRGAPVNGRGNAPAPPARDITYQPRTIVDPVSTLEVATLLAPKGWEIDPGVFWREKHAQFVTLNTAVFDRKSGWAARWIPYDQFSYDPAIFRVAQQQGGPMMTLGGVELIDQLPNALQYIQHIVLPRYRNVQGLKIVAGEDLPRVTQIIDQTQAHLRAVYRQTGREISYSSARMRVEYPGPGNVTLEEEIHCVLMSSWDPAGIAAARRVNLTGEVYFLPDRLYSYTAPKGELDAAIPYLQSIIFSMRGTPRWRAFVENLQVEVGKIAIDRHAMEAAARKAISESQWKSYEDSFKSSNRQSGEVGALLSNTEARNDPKNPKGPQHTAPAGTKSWINGKGEIKDFPPNVNPNASQEEGSNDWTEMTPAANP